MSRRPADVDSEELGEHDSAFSLFYLFPVALPLTYAGAFVIDLAVQSARCAIRMRRHGIRAGLTTCVGSPPAVYGAGEVKLGRVSFRGVAARAEIGATRGGRLTVGDRVFINQGAVVVATSAITIGDDCRIGDYVAIYDSDFHPLEEGLTTRQAPVVIGRNVWLARGVIVLPGTTIGDHSVVAAGSVIRGEVADRTLIAGNPAAPVRQLSARAEWRRG